VAIALCEVGTSTPSEKMKSRGWLPIDAAEAAALQLRRKCCGPWAGIEHSLLRIEQIGEELRKRIRIVETFPKAIMRNLTS